VLAALLVTGAAQAQTRPLLTESATTAPARSLAFEAGVDFIASEPNFLTGRERDRYDAPVLRLVYSPADSVELDLEWVARVGVYQDPDFGDVSDWGDVSLRAKWRFLDGGRERPTLAARFAVALPETTFGNGLGPDTLRVSTQLLLSAPLGDAVVHANAGLAIHDLPLRPHEQADFLAYGLALEAPLGNRWTALAELAGLAGESQGGAAARSEARAGVRYGRGRWRWDAALRRGLAEADGSWGFTAGITWIKGS
jgi:hypothetical protein